jgi:hypothetical protein
MNLFSASEALANAFIGLLVSWAATYYFFPFWGLEPSKTQAVEIVLFFFVLSFMRSYILRRVFAWLS